MVGSKTAVTTDTRALNERCVKAILESIITEQGNNLDDSPKRGN